MILSSPAVEDTGEVGEASEGLVFSDSSVRMRLPLFFFFDDKVRWIVLCQVKLGERTNLSSKFFFLYVKRADKKKDRMKETSP